MNNLADTLPKMELSDLIEVIKAVRNYDASTLSDFEKSLRFIKLVKAQIESLVGSSLYHEFYAHI